ncbi:hypothetical protein [Algibacter mikhailovii]|uniref:hypothetical protein n=1 Tax=Algibacter mikhailovii TaxID=425498 RepID=UPI0024951852|nr:hypothetical protein [Algibacter mikhailovii]
MIKRLLFFVIIIVLSCCESNDGTPDCSTVLCAAPSVLVHLIDNTTKENIILQNNIALEQIIVRDGAKKNNDFTIIEESGLLIIMKKDLKGSIEIEIDSNVITQFSYNTSAPKSNACCDFGELIDVVITSNNYNLEGNTITIFL